MDPANFDKMSRDELVAKARSLGVERPELMTRVELGDEIVRLTQSDPVAQQRARGWLGVARDLVASVVGSGLSLPDAAALIRGDRSVLEFKGPSPVATVTLAEIYATQGHLERALSMLDEVLAREPEHAAAHALRDRLTNEPRGRRNEPAPAASEVVERPPEASGEELPPTEGAAPVSERRAPSFEPEPLASEPEPLASEPEPLASEPEPPAIEHTPRVFEPEPPVFERAASGFEPGPPAYSPEPPLYEAEAAVFEPVPLAPPFPDVSTRLEGGPIDELASLRAAEQLLSDTSLVSEPVIEHVPTLLPPASEQRGVALVVVRRPRQEPLVCWELPELEAPHGASFEVECHAFSGSERGPQRQSLALSISEQRGSAALSGFASASLIRAALGYRAEGAFVPLLIASEVSYEAGALDVRFRPPFSEHAAPTSVELGLIEQFAS